MCLKLVLSEQLMTSVLIGMYTRLESRRVCIIGKGIIHLG